MKTIKIFAVSSLFTLMLSGCQLEGLNVNPNETDDALSLTDPIFGATLRDGFAQEGDDEQRIKSLMIDFYAHVADGGNFVTRNYEMMEDWNQRQYKRVHSTIYTLNLVINNFKILGEEEYKHSIAVAKIWRVFVHASGADFFGPIPFKSYKEDIENPPYMSMEDIYTEYFNELEEAISLLDQTSEEPIFKSASTDILYNNDISKWRKFANSLRLRFALRLSEVSPETCSTEAQKAIDSGVMESKADNAYIPPRANGSWGQDYNYTMFQITWNGAISMTTSFEKLVTGIGGMDFPVDLKNKRAILANKPSPPLTDIHPDKVDPRATKMFDPGYEVGNWRGLPVGIPGSLANNDEYKKNNYAEFGFIIKDGAAYKSRPYDMFLYEEVCFLKAEAAYRNFITGVDAKTEYEEGVRASFETWGVSDKVSEYLTSNEKNLAGTSANFDDQVGPGNTALEKIITQKYIAAFPDVAMESWNDKRRLNLPRFDILMQRYELLYDNSNKDIKDPKNFIKRVQYPQREVQSNKVEYDKGVQMLGGPDNVTTPLWWDLNRNYCTSVE